jgi:hypothetical protein
MATFSEISSRYEKIPLVQKSASEILFGPLNNNRRCAKWGLTKLAIQ